MAKENMDDLHLRIARVTEDLRTIQQELNCAAMQAPSDPELMETLNSLSETEPIETLRSALDQMRQTAAAKTETDEKPKLENSFLDQLSRTDEVMLLHHLALAKQRKPN
jgi:hypothetical protein